MSRAAVIGEPLRIYGYGLAGALLRPAPDRLEAVRALRDLPGDVAVVVLTKKAAEWLAGELALRLEILPVILPEPEWRAAESSIAEAPL
jgi:vacuolar-type H+-ATPase subunit F/Vma7